MLISGAAYPAARKLSQSTYKYNIAFLDLEVKHYFKRKNPETFAPGF